MGEVFITPLGRRNVVVALEIAVEGSDGWKTTFFGDLRDGLIGGF